MKGEVIEPISMHCLRKFLTFFIHVLLIKFSSGRDTLLSGQQFKDGDFLISAKETFTLQFFSPETSTNRYLGILYYNVPEKTVVWVANRDIPINDTSGVLSFQKSNNLAIYGPDLKIPIWSTSFSGRGKNYSAQLQDTGNLVVFEEDKKRVIAWQSFDHPTDTWLPGMKLGVNRKMGLSWSLRSWKSPDDPGTGEASFRFDNENHDLPELTLYHGSDLKWRSGPLNGGGTLIEDMSVEITLNLTHTDNEYEAYLTYGVRDLGNVGLNAIIVMSYSGNAASKTRFPGSPQWQENWHAPVGNCGNYGTCDPNENCYAPSSIGEFVTTCDCLPGSEVKSQHGKLAGCVRKRDNKDCRNGEGFTKLPNMEMPDTATARVDRIHGLKNCEELCWRDCNCTAYANVMEMGNACVMWYGDLMDTKQFGNGRGLDLFVRDVNGTRHRTQQQHHSSSNKKLKVAAVATSVGVVAAFIAIFIFFWCRYRRKHGSR